LSRLSMQPSGLRKTSFDELPQLINVLRGQMSLVGPRPERPHFVSQFSKEITSYGDRHRVPVGMTGWAQIHGLRGDTSLEERARFDNRYIEHWSLGQDLMILGRTLTAIVKDLLTRHEREAEDCDERVDTSGLEAGSVRARRVLRRRANGALT